LETLKIALVDLHKSLGGGQIALFNMAYTLLKRGHEVHIISGIKKIPNRFQDSTFSECNLYPLSGCSNLIQIYNVIEKTKSYITNLNRVHKFDVINAHGISGVTIPSHLQDHLFVTIHGNSLCRILTLLNYTGKNRDILSTVLKYKENFLKNISGHIFQANLEKKACKKAKIVISLTPTEAVYARKYYSISEEKIRIVPNAILFPKTSEYNELPIPEEKKVILNIGALEFIKGTPILAKTMKHILAYTDDVFFVSVGDGPLRQTIKGIKTRFPEKTIMIPRISNSLTSLYRRSTLLLHASLFEAFGMVIAEAMFEEKPVVAFQTASIPDLVEDNVTGLLARPARTKDLTLKTIELLKDDKKVRMLGFNAKKRIEKISSPRIIGRKIENVFKEV